MNNLKPVTIRISEIYSSRQGEGLLTGTDSVFIRTSGCNLRCDFCDTPFTSWDPTGHQMTVHQIMASVEQWPGQHVVITGGEPMLPASIVELTRQIRAAGRHITIETAGTIVRDVECDLMSISPKLSSSTPLPERGGDWSVRHEQTRINLAALTELIKRWPVQLKFVVTRPNDLDEIQDLLGQLPEIPPDRVLLMPEGIDRSTLHERESWLLPLCERTGFRFCPRRHIEWYGNKRGT